MKKIFVFCAFLSFQLMLNAQTKYFDFETTKVDFKINHSTLSESQFVAMVNQLKATPNLNNFERENENTLTFSYQVFDQTKLNDVQKNIQNLISANNVFVEFAELRNVPVVFIPNSYSQSRFFISNIATREQADALENFFLNENKVFLVNADHETHDFFIVYSSDIDYNLVVDILKSQNCVVVDPNDFSKYYE